MTSSKLNSLFVILAVLAVPVAQGSIAVNTGIANNYFDANWAVFNSGGQPYQAAARELAEVASSYFDANGSLINNGSPSHAGSTTTPGSQGMTLEPGKTQ